MVETMKRKNDVAVYFSSSSSSVFRGSSGLIDALQPTFMGRGICRDEPLSQSGKRIQLFKMLCLNVLPILGLWAYTVYTLADSIGFREEYYKRRSALYFSIDIGKLVHRLQVERDMSVLYLSAIGPETKSFLLSEYAKTDEVTQDLTWPSDIDSLNVMFLSKENFLAFLREHRRVLNPNVLSIQNEIDFYSKSIDTIIIWLYNTITESKFSLIWKLLVAYQKLSSAKENLGVERALGTMFYARGGFESRTYFENYNLRLHSFRAYMRSIGMYSTVVDEIYVNNIENLPINFSATIEKFRAEIQLINSTIAAVDVQKARFFFDNMTIYLDTLFNVQTEMGAFVIAKFNNEIDKLTEQLAINAVLLVIVILVCPVVIIATESLTSSIQTYALTLVDKTKELTKEKKRTDGLLYQMVPRQVADMLKKKKKVDAEFFKMVTVCFSDMYGFDKLTVDLTPMEIVELLNALYNTVDDILDDFDVYKVETINDCYMVASGLPKRNKDRHAFEIAEFALNMLRTVSLMKVLSSNRSIQLRIGINSGPCMAGIVGTLMPRYCLFGDTVNTASRMKAYSEPNKIHISYSTYQLLRKTKSFTIKKRGSVSVKGKGDMRTFWLMGKVEDFGTIEIEADIEPNSNAFDITDMPGEIASVENLSSGIYVMPGRSPKEEKSFGSTISHGDVNKEDLPGEITTIESPTYSASLQYPMPGRQPQRRKPILKKSTTNPNMEVTNETGTELKAP
ncbi:Guanylate cyclase 32E,Guanylate cyclase soluble subunit beta-2,Receptor-type guanylate cyclase gcy-19,Retinal guanylyl cyclase 2,Heat-stable enterotoxin receptor,Olfactory guanylyl cyclase GC-D,Atrial natriuretic peptide receptor 2,Receptor-type guanylate cyclase gcy-9,Receptor-type guanylate cyclase Gyc76C,Soluble guanylate cyclase 89Da,Receptor-type guanylate cyclase gcy-28,Speract receptor,Receptor-type guanylate cyclase gcy-13,Receptor-type guanylate cyclase gcy-8,Guanylyl cyclase GC-E,Receptor-type gu|uniref:guanylate cyclase n=1 Tax=Mytilus coruscus TaxID=42192 RepID=A0A6J8BHD2_MYTCO|nr:Guanylate cyclase 32E,Guanylate cyclase soluble subunit beta-2,Receptor-type guanylate cyclase gcy-19,Retinal guanylyl cyclase 2,Heat-stable enterotoxin receptor,Olfactory guanylyl cyclase GC-D,Atrial natriuretic peptide receptor 2,Receptor-type guanylate cyclase gcy-9,Receptor-type guanylate cyclase Gyc76C,Soluble guanylate cyclase 89Da,Receptor-type guanylate cyclase gcy-28,Speract receptor,Receptor-type guanylate cyclase gcy-13,Receptor-type guanylate cyclase gcy-8,Guanylyl cyclase GC-E,Recep